MAMPQLFPKTILSPSELETIKNHKYVSGTYTPFDMVLNPMWTRLTEFLPLWMAPNLVTLLGWFHMILLWVTLALHIPSHEHPTPSWVFFLAAYCLVVYQTLDAMDGKQARRTGSSSPLGQLFDHGCDATTVFLISHSLTITIGFHGTYMQLIAVVAGIFTFFLANWQEYHLQVFPHSVGPIGVTEQQLFLAGIYFVTGLFGTGMWDTNLYVCSLRQLLIGGQLMLLTAVVGMTIHKVLTETPRDSPTGSPLMQLVTPLAVMILALTWPSASLAASPILVLLAPAIVLTHCTCKMLIFSTAKAPFNTFHIEPVPVAIAWVVDHFIAGSPASMILLGITAALNLGMFTHFINLSITEMCLHLGISCFKIGKPKCDNPS